MVDEFELMAEVDEQSFAGQPKLNFGKLTMTSAYKKWENKQPTEVTLAQFAKLSPKERSQEVTFAVDIQEFNPNLQFTYTRRVNVGGVDWNKIFKPSLFKALGITVADDKVAAQKQLSEALRKLNGAYVAVEDVPQTLTKKERDAGETESKYNTVRIHTVYADRAACYGAWKSKYGGGANGAGAVEETEPRFETGIPEGYTAQSWAAMKSELEKKYAEHVQSLNGPVNKRRAAALAYIAAEEAGSTPEQLAELIGV